MVDVITMRKYLVFHNSVIIDVITIRKNTMSSTREKNVFFFRDSVMVDVITMRKKKMFSRDRVTVCVSTVR